MKSSMELTPGRRMDDRIFASLELKDLSKIWPISPASALEESPPALPDPTVSRRHPVGAASPESSSSHQLY